MLLRCLGADGAAESVLSQTCHWTVISHTYLLYYTDPVLLSLLASMYRNRCVSLSLFSSLMKKTSFNIMCSPVEIHPSIHCGLFLAEIWRLGWCRCPWKKIFFSLIFLSAILSDNRIDKTQSVNFFQDQSVFGVYSSQTEIPTIVL